MNNNIRVTDEQITVFKSAADAICSCADDVHYTCPSHSILDALMAEHARADQAHDLADLRIKNAYDAAEVKAKAGFLEGHRAAVEDGLRDEPYFRRLISVLWDSRRMWQTRTEVLDKASDILAEHVDEAQARADTAERMVANYHSDWFTQPAKRVITALWASRRMWQERASHSGQQEIAWMKIAIKADGRLARIHKIALADRKCPCCAGYDEILRIAP